MDLIQLLVLLIIIGMLMWFINTYIPLTQPIKTIINVVVVLIILLWLLRLFGIANYPIGTGR